MKRFRFDELPVISTTGGDLRGYALDNVYIFKGIPYAEAERFQMPHPTTWEGVKECTSYGEVAMLLDVGKPNNELAAPHMYWPMSENCQSLNIWTPSITKGDKKPVMVWLHGGGYSGGSSIEQKAYDGYNMAEAGDVVVVTVNHRLNIFGYLDVSCLGPQYKNSGNAGHADMVAALQWVHDNIENFGGDPENVTIFGQSGGGMKVGDLMNIPAADGLFQKGIMMSGVGEGSGVIKENKKSGDELVKLIAEELGCSLKALPTVPADDLIEAYKKVKKWSNGYSAESPMPNDWYKGWPLDNGFTEHAAKVPFIVGSVFGEFGMLAPYDREAEHTEEEKEALVKVAYGKNGEAVVEEFRKVYPNKDISDALYIDRMFRIPSVQIAKLVAKMGGTAYVYKFDLNFPNFRHNIPAWHCGDIPFVFNNCDTTEACGFEDAYKLQDIMFRAVMNFAHTGDPNGEGLPTWPKAEADSVSTMTFDREVTVRKDHDDKLLGLCDEVMPRFNIGIIADNKTQH